MLVLSRRKDEKIVIREDIIITIVDIRGSSVRIGIDAPRNVPIARDNVVKPAPLAPPAEEELPGQAG